jgi:phosphate transport system substrate-binding protein
MKKCANWQWAMALALIVGAGCTGGSESSGDTPPQTGDTTGGGSPAANLKGEIKIDGSSTVFPISMAAAENFMGKNKDVRITVGESGTSGGFKKFLAGEIEICDASRPISEEEIKGCAEKGIEFVEIPVAFDGLTVAIHKSNTFATSMTVAELKKIWEPNSTVKTWKDVRPDWPAERI